MEIIQDNVRQREVKTGLVTHVLDQRLWADVQSTPATILWEARLVQPSLVGGTMVNGGSPR